jgi:AraC-like DNA-binding protein
VCFKDIDALSEDEVKNIRTDIFEKYPKTPYVTFSNRKGALKLFYKIVSTPHQSPLEQKAALIRLIDMLIANNYPMAFEEESASSYSIAAQLKDYLDAGQGISSTLDSLAHQFNYSKYYLERLFKKCYGLSIISYRNERRLQISKNMLTEASVSSVAESLGFSSIYVFSRAFKNRFGISPTEYKEKG